MLEDLTFKSLGIVNYHETLEQMRTHINEDEFKNEIWILEHPPVFTLGTAADKKHILDSFYIVGSVPINNDGLDIIMPYI